MIQSLGIAVLLILQLFDWNIAAQSQGQTFTWLRLRGEMNWIPLSPTGKYQCYQVKVRCRLMGMLLE